MRRIILFLLMIGSAGSVQALADEVIFKNGEKVTGKVVELADGKMKITSDTMGDVSAPLDSISTFSTDDPITIYFTDGSIFQRNIMAHRDGWIKIVVGPAMTPTEFKIADIEKINPPKVRWKGSISAGTTVSRGNTYAQDASASINAVRRSEIDRFTIDAAYYGKREKDKDTKDVSTTERKAFGELKYDYFFIDEIYAYANARAERDASADIDLRFITGVGAGYQIYETETFNLAVEGGLTWISENYDGTKKDTSWMGARIAYNLEKDFNSYVTLFSKSEWFPGFEGEGGHLVSSRNGVRSSLTDSMFAEFTTYLVWDSTPADNTKRTDVLYTLNLGWTF